MPWFRASNRPPNAGPPASAGLSPEQVRAVIADVIRPAHFFVSGPVHLEWEEKVREEVAWELFHGRLLDPAHTRMREAFEAWNVYRRAEEARAEEPLLSIKLDAANGRVHVTRAIRCWVREGYHAGGNVYLSREAARWVRELVGTIELARFHGVADFRDELQCQVFQAVVGTSRLPLTSVEAPLPEFSLGQMAYFCRESLAAESPTVTPMRSPRELLEGTAGTDLARVERVKVLETILRATADSELEEMAGRLVERWRDGGRLEQTIPRLFRQLFDEATLSPYTDFVPKTLALLDHLVMSGALRVEAQADFLSHLLRQLGRHLTAYDLVTFHHRGANYPDALLLDAALKAYLRLAERHAGLFVLESGAPAATQRRGQVRRRALRQAWLLRRFYEGHPVPDVPTSPGENARILPAPHVRVPEEQILDPSTRTRKLFVNDLLAGYLGPAGREVLRQSMRDLRHPEELCELGLALFLDRPLGAFKAPAEPDQTLLFSYEAFSRSVARQRLLELDQRWGLLEGAAENEVLQAALGALNIEGVAPAAPSGPPRPGAVSLADALRVSPDFLIRRTTARSVTDFLTLFDFSPLRERFNLDYLAEDRPVLIMRHPARPGAAEGGLLIFDDRLHRRLELRVDATGGYASRAGIEFPAGGLRVVRLWDECAEEEPQEHRPNMVIGVR